IGIRDDGIGIPAEMDIYKTNSLGFKLIRSLVLQLNGSVIVRSDGGTEVIVEFPLQSSDK
ncbi:MAG: sensor histidine kinase, partial [Methanoregulaceae archaeon]|nr:sensor histidine kinase [Methanoregulaceae archaeon]